MRGPANLPLAPSQSLGVLGRELGVRLGGVARPTHSWRVCCVRRTCCNKGTLRRREKKEKQDRRRNLNNLSNKRGVLLEERMLYQ